MVKQNKTTSDRKSGTDDDEVYDEIDTYHLEDRKLGKLIKNERKLQVHEILNVEGDLSDDEDDGNGSSDFDDSDDQNTEASSREQWGKKRSNFYNTSYVDKDFGGAGDDEDEEQAQLEEEDANARQRALDAAASESNILDSLLNEEDTSTEVLKDASSVWNSSEIKKVNKMAVRILNDYQIKQEMFNVIIDPLHAVAKILPDESPLKKKINMSCDAYGKYLSTVAIWLSLKASSLLKKDANDMSVDDHPALEHILKLKQILDRVDGFVSRNSDLLSSLIRKAKQGKNVNVIPPRIILTEKAKNKLDSKLEKMASVDAKDQISNGLESVDADTRRAAQSSILKNKDYNNKKNSKISRMRKKDQYRKAEQKHRSQVPAVRTETSKYGGEVRGIRASTVKSIKLKA